MDSSYVNGSFPQKKARYSCRPCGQAYCVFYNYALSFSCKIVKLTVSLWIYICLLCSNVKSIRTALWSVRYFRALENVPVRNSTWREDVWLLSFVVDDTMGTVERVGDDHTSEMESGEEEEVVGGGELTQQLLKG